MVFTCPRRGARRRSCRPQAANPNTGNSHPRLQSEYSMLYYKISIKRPFSKEEITHALQKLRQGSCRSPENSAPFCGAAVEQTGVNDETAVFTTLPDDMKDPVETGPIDTSAFDAAMRDEKQQLPVDDTAADPLARHQSQYSGNPSIPTQAAMRPIDTPPVCRTAGTPERRTTYYNGEVDPKRPAFTKAVPGKNAAPDHCAGGHHRGGFDWRRVWYFTEIHTRPTKTSSWPKSMDRGNFDKALEYYQKAQAEAQGPGSSMRPFS